LGSSHIYTAVTNRLLHLAAQLSPGRQATVPAATPDWTVSDTYRHLAGATADFLDHRLDAMGTPAWTAAQIAARAGQNLAEVCVEWASRAPALAALMNSDPALLPRLALDYWTHEQDIRLAVGLAPLREDPNIALMAATLLDSRARPYARTGSPAVRVVATDGPVDLVLGSGASALTLRASGFELLRMVNSRRTIAQCLAAEWIGGDAGDRTAVIQALATFPLPTTDQPD
jgi:uncharacterized protein (TIGR03083 family)